jgi:hypothetical protein
MGRGRVSAFRDAGVSRDNRAAPKFPLYDASSVALNARSAGSRVPAWNQISVGSAFELGERVVPPLKSGGPVCARRARADRRSEIARDLDGQLHHPSGRAAVAHNLGALMAAVASARRTVGARARRPRRAHATRSTR